MSERNPLQFQTYHYGAPPAPRPGEFDWWKLSQTVIPACPSAEAIALRVAELLKPVLGKVDPPPAEAKSEVAGLISILTALESLPEHERTRVLRYVRDRYPEPSGKIQP